MQQAPEGRPPASQAELEPKGACSRVALPASSVMMGESRGAALSKAAEQPAKSRETKLPWTRLAAAVQLELRKVELRKVELR